MISIQKAVLKLILLGAIGGWLGGACVNVSEGILEGLTHVNAFKSGLVGAISNLVLAIPWIYSINHVEKLSEKLEKPFLRWGSDVIGGGFGVISSIFAVGLFFLFWPYEAHGRSGAYKTVMAIVGTNPGSLFGIGGLVGVYASSWIRPTQEKSAWWMDILLPLAILGGLIGIVGSNTKEIVDEPEVAEMTEEAKECCALAYRAFVEKVGVSYAIFEAEKYCEIECPIVSECVDECSATRDACGTERSCKDAYRACVLTCPNIEVSPQ